jgi:hypothetical protein
MVRTALAYHGVDLSIPFEISLSPHGRVVVDGEHPDRALIEDLLRDHPTFSDAFRDLATGQAPPPEQEGGRPGRDFCVVWNGSQCMIHPSCAASVR